MQRTSCFRLVLFAWVWVTVGCDSTDFSGSSASQKTPSPKDDPVQLADGDRERNAQTADDGDKGTKKGPALDFDDDARRSKDSAGDRPDLESATDIQDYCNEAKIEVVERVLNYPARQDCAWNQNGKLEEDNGHLQARHEDLQTVDLPEDSVICDIGIRSDTSQFRYDDTMFLVLDEFVLISSNDNVIGDFERDGALVRWNWDRIRGLKRNFDKSQSFCFGSSSSCQVPGHDKEGALAIAFDQDDFSHLALEILDKDHLDFKLVTTGDDNDGDCQHSPLNLTVRIEFVGK